MNNIYSSKMLLSEYSMDFKINRCNVDVDKF